MTKVMRKLGYKKTQESPTKITFEKKEYEHFIGICYTPLGEISDYYIYKQYRKITCQQDIDNTQAAYKILLRDLEKLQNVERID